jgi:hypothetical protein
LSNIYIHKHDMLYQQVIQIYTPNS